MGDPGNTPSENSQWYLKGVPPRGGPGRRAPYGAPAYLHPRIRCPMGPEQASRRCGAPGRPPLLDEVLKKTGKSSEFFEIINKRVISYPRNPLFPDLGLHTMIADKTGDAFILEEGNDTNRISPISGDFIVMTNFPNGNFKETDYNKVFGIGADRYICAYEYIQNHIHSFGINEAFEALNKTSQKNTLCSIVYDPLENEIYISFKKDLSKRWSLKIRYAWNLSTNISPA